MSRNYGGNVCKSMKAIVPAAGMGTRLLPATKAIPKEMLPLVDKPLIQYAIEEALSCGLCDIVVVTGRGKSAIEDHFDLNFELEQRLWMQERQDLVQSLRGLTELNIAYVRQHEPLGLGHAVLQAERLVGDQPCAVTLADDVIVGEPPCLAQLLAVFGMTGETVVALMEVEPNDVASYGIVSAEVESVGVTKVFRIHEVVEKPSWEQAPSRLAVIGRYVLHPDVMNALHDIKPSAHGEIQLSDALHLVAKSRPVFGVQFSGRRFDAGTKLGLIKAAIHVALERQDMSGELAAFIREIGSLSTCDSAGTQNDDAVRHCQ